MPCTCEHCTAKHNRFRANIVAHNGLPIIDARVHLPRRIQLTQAIEFIQSSLSSCSNRDQPTLERKLDELTTELTQLT